MTLNTSEVLDLSKENVQPLRQGRKAAQLKTALQAQTDPEMQHRLLKERERFEFMIRMYEGDDPLEPYYEYAAWLEQSFPRLGRESNLLPLLENVLMKFKDNEKYRQDPRFVHLLIKYINAQSNPLELYQLSYNQGLGTMCSALYKAWAEELDKSNDFKRADQIYQLGLQCRAQPIEELQNAHIQFQLSIARKMIEGNINNNNTEQNTENSRAALSKLQPSKVKSNRISKDTAGIFQVANRETKNNAAVGKFKVYQEDEPDGIVKADFKNKSEKISRGSIAERENIMKAGKWTGQKQKQSVSRPSMPTTPSFQIHEDPEAACDMVRTVIRPRALKLRREEFKCPVAIFEKEDPTKRPMYPKDLVYVGDRDIQLEELRAAMYWRRVEKEEQRKQYLQKDAEALMETPNKQCFDQPKNKSEAKLPQSHSSCETYRNYVTENSSSKVQQNLPMEPLNNKTEPNSDNLHSCLKTSEKKVSTDVKNSQFSISPADQSYKKLEKKTEPLYHIHETSQRNVSAENDPLVGLFEKGGCAPHYSPSTSFTVNTRAAMNVIQTMWASPLPDSTVKKPMSDFDDSMFKVPSRSPPVSRHAQKKLTFPIFSDDDSKLSRPSDKLSFPVFCDDVPVTSTQKMKSPQISPLDKLSFPVFAEEMPATSTQKSQSTEVTPANKAPFSVCTDDMLVTPTQKSNDSKKTSGKLSFPIFVDEFPPTSTQKSVLKATPDQRPFQLFTDTPAASLQKPMNLKSTADKLSFPMDDMPVISTHSDSKKSNAENKFSFPIYTDDGIMPLMGTKSETKRNQFSDVEKLLFPIDKDDDIPSSSVKSTEVCTPVQSDKYSIPLIVPVNLADTPLQPENKENLPPKSYCTPIERRPLSGILTPACNVSVQPLDDDDSEDDEDYCKMIPKGNDFDEETCSTKAFAIALPSSTPFGRSRQSSSRKSLLYNGSYIAEEDTPKSTTEDSKHANGQHLSLILENSKEQGSNSSGGSSAVHK
ncbi:probable inactive serine/threonine-protein kinase bub1 [Planococcus citri]|uniref:probable inactive serine/threonine-protein kinase bub1 n=1 Tax=Planococcus citri TaxID=170843 RepID=UPI0031F89E38